MWKILYQLASPKTFHHLVSRITPWLGLCAMVFLTIGVIWGLFFTPSDFQQGDAFRIIYIHVPAAFLSIALYAGMGFLAILLLVWRLKMAGIILRSAAEVGASMAFLALVTGSIWGKPMWGTWWIWDARLTSELILLFMYAAVLAIGSAYQNKDHAERVMAILALVGLIDLPVIHYSVYWWNTLHQGATLSLLSKPKIANSMLYPLLLTLFGFFVYCIWLILLKAKNQLLLREKRQRWIKEMFMREIECKI